MINILHLYYDLLNLYGENANTRCLVHNLKLNNIKVNVDLKSINDKIDLSKYDIIYIGQGSEDNLQLVRTDILNRKEEFKKYIESNKLLLLTGNSMDLFGSYIEIDNKKFETLNIFDYFTKLSNTFNFKNASTDRIVGEIMGTTNLIKEKIIGFQNRCDQNYNIKSPLFKLEQKYSNNGENNQEGFKYKNVYATHIIGPLLIRNPYFTDYLLKEVCKSKKLEYKSLDTTAKEAYKKYLENFI